MSEKKFNNYLNNLSKKNKIEIKTKQYKKLLNKIKEDNLLNKNKNKENNSCKINKPNLPNLPDNPLTKEELEKYKKFEK